MFDNFRWTSISEKRNNLTQKYEPLQVDILRCISRKCSNCVFIDIGANIGVYSIVLAAEESVSKVHAFEPVPSLAKEMRRNIDLNGIKDKTEMYEFVLSDESGRANFIVRSDFAGDSGVQETHLFSDLPYRSVESYRKCKLDDVLNFSNREIVVKVDVEGHEIQVLKGAKELLKNNRGYIQLELLNKNQEDLARELLRDIGWFRLFKLDRDVYFSNVKSLNSPRARLATLEAGLAEFIDRTRRAEGAPARRQIIPGITVEVRRDIVNKIKKFLRRSRQKQ
ncbi:FkbM family methyltransferase [Salaquimonas pukyongi]|uniref:FkbM family methyltransferase n=1 Tax=Salaquimonas pukyongi TaxID=2712698 RepID=UPI00096B88AC|nr:FkbM family methyltransferase [Salaquimonas pukyongi]